MSSSKADPRREERIVPFHLPPKGEEEEDYNHILATFVGEFSFQKLFDIALFNLYVSNG